MESPAASSPSSSDESSSEGGAVASEVSQRLTKDERKDLVSSLEHIVALGSHCHNQSWREKLWQSRQKGLKAKSGGRVNQGETETDVNSMDESEALQKDDLSIASRLLHAEDYRIFGRRGGAGESVIWKWPQDKPKTRKRKRVRDDEWDNEHGDRINILEFTKSRLSRQVPRGTHKKPDFLGSDALLSPFTSGVTVPESDVPHALMQRCWERAVHAASCTLSCSRMVETHSKAPESSQSNAEKNTPSYADAVEKCLKLGICLPSETPLECPACSASFDSYNDLQIHFFGSKRQKGCCWNPVREKQLAMIDKVLGQEVINLTDGLVHVVLSYAKIAAANKRGTGGSRGGNKQFCWQDVMRFLECALNSSESKATTPNPSPRAASRRPFLNTLGVHPTLPPVVLNRNVVDAVWRRLIDRYADVPR